MAKRVLIAGESWSSTTIHTKGFDSFITTAYAEGVQWLRDALEQGGFEVDYLPNHKAATDFPQTAQQLAHYDGVILSDIGANTLLLHPDTFGRSQLLPNRCILLRDYVLQGGGLCMIGGYLTFTGIDAKGRWRETPVHQVLPVDLLQRDDRVEAPQGMTATVTQPHHPVMRGLPAGWPPLLGYNQTVAAPTKGTVVATIGQDPLVAVGEFGSGRSGVFTSDCSPHWAPEEFCHWQHYPTLWCNLINWITKREAV